MKHCFSILLRSMLAAPARDGDARRVPSTMAGFVKNAFFDILTILGLDYGKTTTNAAKFLDRS
jgi:hypothetical protein